MSGAGPGKLARRLRTGRPSGRTEAEPGLLGVLFDKDGTLFDFTATWAPWCRALLSDLSQGDAALATRLADAIGFDPRLLRFAPDSPVLADTPAVIAGRLEPHLRAWSRDDLVDHLNRLAAAAEPVPAVPLAPLLGGLARQGLRLGLCTNDGEAPARAHLERAGVAGLFDFVAGFDSGHGGKPSPGPLLAFARAIAAPPERIAMVGDSAHDMTAGRAAGMIPVGIATGMTDRAALAELADVVLPDIGALPDWIASLPSRD